MQEEITEYYRLIAVLESQQQNNSSNVTLRRILVWIEEPLERLKLLAILLDNVKGLKGGALLSAVRAFSHHGAPFISTFINTLLAKVSVQCIHSMTCDTWHVQISKPVMNMIKLWVFEGELLDPHHEFFVAADNQVPLERLWSDKYTLRQHMIPSFISTDLANKVSHSSLVSTDMSWHDVTDIPDRQVD